MTKQISKRLDDLEQSVKPVHPDPGWLSLGAETWEHIEAGDITPESVGMEGPVKVYIGINPDDWDNDEQDEQEIE